MILTAVVRVEALIVLTVDAAVTGDLVELVTVSVVELPEEVAVEEEP